MLTAMNFSDSFLYVFINSTQTYPISIIHIQAILSSSKNDWILFPITYVVPYLSELLYN